MSTGLRDALVESADYGRALVLSFEFGDSAKAVRDYLAANGFEIGDSREQVARKLEFLAFVVRHRLPPYSVAALEYFLALHAGSEWELP